jgi:hypothetical protein
MQAALGAPGDGDGDGGRPALPFREGGAPKGVVTILPGGFDEHAPQMRIAEYEVAPRVKDGSVSVAMRSIA